jgi:predicted ATPase
MANLLPKSKFLLLLLTTNAILDIIYHEKQKMITKLTINKNALESNSEFSYVNKIPFFNLNNEISFQPGLNILFSPNGSGKSTLLKMLSLFTASNQGGVSTITNQWIHDAFMAKKLNGISIKHDGQPVFYSNPREAVGLSHGAFDDDFFNDGIQNTLSKKSSGSTTIQRLDKSFSILSGATKSPTSIVSKIGANNDAYEFLKGNIPTGQQTHIFDEPETAMAIPAQEKLFEYFQKLSHNTQIIIATHSPFALNCKANFIEFDDRYVKSSIESIGRLSLSLTQNSRPQKQKLP